MLPINENFGSLNMALPKAAYALSQLDGIELYHDDYGLRHPLGAYNISLSSIGKRVSRVVEVVNELQTESWNPGKASPRNEALLEATDHLLDAAMEHLDVCHSILKCFFKPDEERGRKLAYQLLKKEIEPYRNHIGSVDNYINHKQGALRLIQFVWPGGRCLGYFVEGNLGEGMLGPAREIHKDSNSAFSFNRDVRFHVCSVFAVGARLASVLHSIDKRIVPRYKTTENYLKANDWITSLKLVSGLPYTFFHDEVSIGIPEIRLSKERLIVTVPGDRRKVSIPPNGSRISLVYIGDGVTRGFKLPYWGHVGVRS